MKIRILSIVLYFAALSSCATGGFQQIPPADHGELFQSFNRINQNIWGSKQVVSNPSEYKVLLEGEKESDSKKAVQKYLEGIKITICPLEDNFIVCGYWEKYGYTFCDNARKHMKNQGGATFFIESHKESDNSYKFQRELGCASHEGPN